LKSWVNTSRDRGPRTDPSHPTEALEKTFLAEAASAGMVGLPGHRSVGGIRASIYNANSVEASQTLASFMNDFAKKNG
jgi:phosphoserine aminotransferase